MDGGWGVKFIIFWKKIKSEKLISFSKLFQKKSLSFLFQKIEKRLLEKNLSYWYDIELLNNVWVIILVYKIYINIKGMWYRLMPIRCKRKNFIWSMRLLNCFKKLPWWNIIIYYLGQVNINYIILEMLKFSKIISSKSKDIVKENSGYLTIFHLLKWMF